MYVKLLSNSNVVCKIIYEVEKNAKEQYICNLCYLCVIYHVRVYMSPDHLSLPIQTSIFEEKIQRILLTWYGSLLLVLWNVALKVIWMSGSKWAVCSQKCYLLTILEGTFDKVSGLRKPSALEKRISKIQKAGLRTSTPSERQAKLDYAPWFILMRILIPYYGSHKTD